MKAMKVAKKSTAMKAAMAAKVAAPPKRTAMKEMKKQAAKFKHTTWTYVNVKNSPSIWPGEELDPMVAIK